MDVVYRNSNSTLGYSCYDIRMIPAEKIGALTEYFSEGSIALKECLLDIYRSGVDTRACCKGFHITMHEDSPDLCGNAYIAFSSGDWKDYLSDNIINDNDVVIEDSAIYYFGKDRELFFQVLGRNFQTGKKKNQPHLSEKMNSYSDESKLRLLRSSYEYSLRVNGFSDEQINTLLTIADKRQEIVQKLKHGIGDEIDNICKLDEYGAECHEIFKKFFAENLQHSRAISM